ncbi:hypothetical protein ACFQL0_14855 [Haloplanus litoreus]|uniref:hypothetical protein n=1 Tax=Haloplanus litoreus TaxID=767515 RepID=UPI003613DFFF
MHILAILTAVSDVYRHPMAALWTVHHFVYLTKRDEYVSNSVFQQSVEERPFVDEEGKAYVIPSD